MTRSSLAAVLVAALAVAGAFGLSPCTSNDIGHTYLPCSNNNTRTAIYYFTSACDPSDPSTPALPPSTPNLPCSIECKEGQYLPFTSTTCQQCTSGSYSKGSTLSFDSWATLPNQLRTDCYLSTYAGGSCNGWRVNGAYIDSGNSTGVNNVRSSLYLTLSFVRNSGNYIKFIYQVDAENCGSYSCDGLIFYVDNVIVMPIKSTALSWTTFTFNVTKGTHDFRWVYSKDYSVSNGADRAALQVIDAFGATLAAETCSACPEGTIAATDGSSSCKTCPFNTRATGTSNTACTNCAATEYAFPGSGLCQQLPTCTLSNYYIKRNTCNPAAGVQTRDYVLRYLVAGSMPTCNPGSFDPGFLVPEQCFCEKGTVLNVATGTCDICPTGYGSIGGICQQCAAGTQAIRIRELTDFSKFPAGFSTSCTGNCDSGWTAQGNKLDAGGVLGSYVVSVLTTTVTYYTTGEIRFTYGLVESNPIDDIYMQFQMGNSTDGDLYNEVYLPSLTVPERNISRIVPEGTYNVTWIFRVNYLSGNGLNARGYLASFRFTGVPDGGAYRCELCPPGSGSPDVGQVTCPTCTPGTYNDATGGYCHAPLAGYYVSKSGATAPTKCGNGTTSVPPYTDCTTDCTYSTTITDAVGTRTLSFDLNALYDPETMKLAGFDASDNAYFINLCQRGSSNASCFDQDGNALGTFGCQTVKGWGYSVDIGTTIGFNPPTNMSADQGLLVTLENGTPCSGSRGPRTSYINLLCDVNAGVGFPTLAGNKTAEIPKGSCRYYFTWRTQYACPICTNNDVEWVLGACENGFKTYTINRLRNCTGSPTPPSAIPCIQCPFDSANRICSGRGLCDDLIGKCNCESKWKGDLCDECAAGRFGALCDKECPGGVETPCSGHGACNSGRTGSGACNCSTGWDGAACTTCAAGFSGDTCQALPASITDVVSLWVIILGVVIAVAVLIAIIVLWRAKKRVEYKYSSLLTSQPVELSDTTDDRMAGLPDDEDREAATPRGQL